MTSKGGLKAIPRFSLKICDSKDLPNSKGIYWRQGKNHQQLCQGPSPTQEQSSTGDWDTATSTHISCGWLQDLLWHCMQTSPLSVLTALFDLPCQRWGQAKCLWSLKMKASCQGSIVLERTRGECHWPDEVLAPLKFGLLCCLLVPLSSLKK